MTVDYLVLAAGLLAIVASLLLLAGLGGVLVWALRDRAQEVARREALQRRSARQAQRIADQRVALDRSRADQAAQQARADRTERQLAGLRQHRLRPDRLSCRSWTDVPRPWRASHLW